MCKLSNSDWSHCSIQSQCRKPEICRIQAISCTWWGRKTLQHPTLKNSHLANLNLIPDVLICAVWDTVYMPGSGETCSCLLFWHWKENITSGSSACFCQWNEVSWSGGVREMEQEASIADCPAGRQLHALLWSGPDFSWQMLPAGVGSDDSKCVSKATDSCCH